MYKQYSVRRQHEIGMSLEQRVSWTEYWVAEGSVCQENENEC